MVVRKLSVVACVVGLSLFISIPFSCSLKDGSNVDELGSDGSLGAWKADADKEIAHRRRSAIGLQIHRDEKLVGKTKTEVR